MTVRVVNVMKYKGFVTAGLRNFFMQPQRTVLIYMYSTHVQGVKLKTKTFVSFISVQMRTTSKPLGGASIVLNVL